MRIEAHLGLGGAVIAALALACSSSHAPSDGAVVRRDAGGSPTDDGATPVRDGGGVPGRDTGPWPVVDGGGRDLLEACERACGHVADCMSMMALECIDGCLDLRRTLTDPECRAIAFEALDCIEALECYWLRDERIGYSECAGVLNRLEDTCLESDPPPPPPPAP